MSSPFATTLRNSVSRLGNKAIFGSLSLLALVVVWFLLSGLHLVQPLFLPSPLDLAMRLEQERGALVADVSVTVGRILLGFLAGAWLGILGALLMERSIIANALLNPIVQMLKAIPAIAIAPFALLWFGIGSKGIFFLVVWGVFFVTIIDATEAIKNVSHVHKWAAASLGASPNFIYRHVVFPSIAPGIIGGLRVAAVIAFNQAVLGEFNSPTGGIGQLIIRGYRYIRVDMLFLGILLIATLSVLVDWLVAAGGRRWARWVE